MIPASKRNIALLGATGSIAESALDVIARHPDRFALRAVTANRQWRPLFEVVRRFRPDYAALVDVTAARELERAVRGAGLHTHVLSGVDGPREVASLPEVDTVIAAIVGAVGLLPTLAAARAGKRILLANKETLVLAGGLFMSAVREHNATLLPIDSEHNAIFQCLPRLPSKVPVPNELPHELSNKLSNDGTGDLGAMGVRRIVLTASGGPFRTTPLAELSAMTPDQACAHPNWRMGRKISVDSATMMNKGLEVIEAHWLFGAPPEAIEVVVHHQSIVHSMVEYVDGSVLAQLGNPDMRTPIAQALAWPERIESGVASLDLTAFGALNFSAPEHARFPCLALAYAALRAGGSAPAMLNAANEIAVAAFLEGRAGFEQIASACAETLSRLPTRPLSTLDDALAADIEARDVARQVLNLSHESTPA